MQHYPDVIEVAADMAACCLDPVFHSLQILVYVVLHCDNRLLWYHVHTDWSFATEDSGEVVPTAKTIIQYLGLFLISTQTPCWSAAFWW